MLPAPGLPVPPPMPTPSTTSRQSAPGPRGPPLMPTRSTSQSCPLQGHVHPHRRYRQPQAFLFQGRACPRQRGRCLPHRACPLRGHMCAADAGAISGTGVAHSGAACAPADPDAIDNFKPAPGPPVSPPTPTRSTALSTTSSLPTPGLRAPPPTPTLATTSSPPDP